MIRKEVQRWLPLLQAFACDAPLQIRTVNGWEDTTEVNPLLDPCEFRVRPSQPGEAPHPWPVGVPGGNVWRLHDGSGFVIAGANGHLPGTYDTLESATAALALVQAQGWGAISAIRERACDRLITMEDLK